MGELKPLLGATATTYLSVLALLIVPAARLQGLPEPEEVTPTWQRPCTNPVAPRPDTSASLLQSDFVRTKASVEHTRQDDHTKNDGQSGTAATVEANGAMSSRVQAQQGSAQMAPTGSSTVASILPLPTPATPPRLKRCMMTLLERLTHLRASLVPLGTSLLQKASGSNSIIVSTTVVLCILMVAVLVCFMGRMLPSPNARPPLRLRPPSTTPVVSGTRSDANVYRADASVSRLSSYSLQSAVDLPSANPVVVKVPSSARASPVPPPRSPEPYLCPELVVPESTECTLLIPPLPLSGNKVEGECTIDDSRGFAVFRAVFKPWDATNSAGGSPKRHCMHLESVTATAVFAYCGPGVVDMDGQPVELEVFRQTGEPFGVIRRSSALGLFSVFSRSPHHWQIHFYENFAQSPVHAYDENGALLAILEFQDEGKRWLIRIAPLCDAGLMITSVLGVMLIRQKAVSYSPPPSRAATGRLSSSVPS